MSFCVIEYERLVFAEKDIDNNLTYYAFALQGDPNICDKQGNISRHWVLLAHGPAKEVFAFICRRSAQCETGTLRRYHHRRQEVSLMSPEWYISTWRGTMEVSVKHLGELLDYIKISRGVYYLVKDEQLQKVMRNKEYEAVWLEMWGKEFFDSQDRFCGRETAEIWINNPDDFKAWVQYKDQPFVDWSKLILEGE